jgi:hypothetical protein
MTGLQPRRCRAFRRVALTIAVLLVASALVAPAVGAADADADYDCTDFDTQKDAQAFYEATGGPVYDPYNLDEDEDGIACEEWGLDYEQAASGGDDSAGKDGVDFDCADFGSQAAAQRYFEADGGSVRKNVDHLDPNHNGEACEGGEPG